MNKNYFAPGATYNDNHREYHIDARGNDLASVLRACDAEDVTPEPKEEPNKPTGLFPCITKAAYEAGKAQQVDDDLRSASKSAPKLVKAINLNEALDYLDTKNMSSVDLYNLLDKHYDLSFTSHNFSIYRSKVGIDIH